MFTSVHYVGKDMNTTYISKEPWKKVFGPVFVYLNSAFSPNHLWTDAKQQVSSSYQRSIIFHSILIIMIIVYVYLKKIKTIL